jgi:SH3-like domain-containing protein
MNKLFLLIASILFSIPVYGSSNKQSVPRFVTIKFNEVNARTGPNIDCPVEWVFIKKGEPVEIIAESDQWRKIIDNKGEGGWVHTTALSAKRSVIIKPINDILPLLAAPGKYDEIIAKLKSDLRCGLVKCQKDWCQIICQTHKGWVPSKFVWGIYPHEAS